MKSRPIFCRWPGPETPPPGRSSLTQLNRCILTAATTFENLIALQAQENPDRIQPEPEGADHGGRQDNTPHKNHIILKHKGVSPPPREDTGQTGGI